MTTGESAVVPAAAAHGHPGGGMVSGHLLGVMERILMGVVLAWLAAVAIGLHRGKLTWCDRFW